MHTKGPWKVAYNGNSLLSVYSEPLKVKIVGAPTNEEGFYHQRDSQMALDFELIAAAPELLDVVRDCVNFLADLNSTSPFDAEYMEQRAKQLHKRAYTAHSKAKGQ